MWKTCSRYKVLNTHSAGSMESLQGVKYLNPIKFRAPLIFTPFISAQLNNSYIRTQIIFDLLQNLYFCGSLSYMTENVQQDSVWHMPKYGLSLIRIFPYMDRIVSAFSHISTEIQENTDTILPIIWIREMQENMDTILPIIWIRESPYFGTFHAVREQELDAN